MNYFNLKFLKDFCLILIIQVKLICQLKTNRGLGKKIKKRAQLQPFQNFRSIMKIPKYASFKIFISSALILIQTSNKIQI